MALQATLRLFQFQNGETEVQRLNRLFVLYSGLKAKRQDGGITWQERDAYDKLSTWLNDQKRRYGQPILEITQMSEAEAVSCLSEVRSQRDSIAKASRPGSNGAHRHGRRGACPSKDSPSC